MLNSQLVFAISGKQNHYFSEHKMYLGPFQCSTVFAFIFYQIRSYQLLKSQIFLRELLSCLTTIHVDISEQPHFQLQTFTGPRLYQMDWY